MDNYFSRRKSISRHISVSLVCAVTGLLSAIQVSADDNVIKKQGAWLIGLKVLTLGPSERSVTSVGGEAKVSSDTVPELDIRYFLTDNIALETILGYTKHEVSAVETEYGDVNLGSTKVLPPTLSLQYHFNRGLGFSPYVGAGINYTFFFDHDPGDALDISYEDGFGFALNAGFDYVFSERHYLNVDIKKYTLSTEVSIDAGLEQLVDASVDLDPLAISVGYGWIF
jgi:outer membrane protein